jgi:hypothetical protein
VTFLFELREAARHQVKPEKAALLRAAADTLAAAIEALHKEPTVGNMSAVNCAWARAGRVYKDTIMPEPPVGNGGAMPVPERLAA